ncbi:carboxymuconolactone decarboxylase family protein [Marinobacter sp.]|uniref:carboxymuconolactone decarboxylase family protein n=1 Tax=Marinobacter sp. TaxID=50741 RepID=UPI003566277B
MSDFPTHDVESAPEKSKPLLENSLKGFGMIPGLHAVMAEAPGVLEAYQKLHQLVLDSSFDNDEKTVVWQTINVENACHYCVPAHTGIARMMEVSDDITNALRDEAPLPNDKLEALRTFTLAVMNKNGTADAAQPASVASILACCSRFFCNRLSTHWSSSFRITTHSRHWIHSS